MDTVIRNPARKEFERIIALNKRPNRVFALFEEETDRAMGIRLDWFPHEHASSPMCYLTADNGETFRQVSNYFAFGGDGIDIRTENEETNPESLTALRELLAAWRDTFKAHRQRDTANA